jgi:hypothetical protein
MTNYLQSTTQNVTRKLAPTPDYGQMALVENGPSIQSFSRDRVWARD